MSETAKLPVSLPRERESVIASDKTAREATPLLTVIVPAYNEARTIAELLRRVCSAPYTKQVIVVDDGSTDGTAGILESWEGRSHVELVRHSRNLGKGAAIRSGLERARGQFTIIQDADLEYDPQDYPRLIEPLASGVAQVVFGSRYLCRQAGMPRRWGLFRLGVSVLNCLTRLLYGARLTDEATCYKAVPTALLRSMDLRCDRFEFCPELTAKVSRMGLKILEVPIHYDPRNSRAGKKIRWTDGLAAIATLWKWRNWRPAVKGRAKNNLPVPCPLTLPSPGRGEGKAEGCCSAGLKGGATHGAARRAK